MTGGSYEKRATSDRVSTLPSTAMYVTKTGLFFPTPAGTVITIWSREVVPSSASWIFCTPSCRQLPQPGATAPLAA